MKTKQWIVVSVASLLGVGSSIFSIWFRANAQAFYVPAGSMTPTIPIGSRVLGWMHAYDAVAPQRNDIALVELPLSLVSPGSGSGKTTFVKRVIGVPGDRVELKHMVLSVNGKRQSEPFAHWVPPYYYDMKVIGGKVYSRDVGSDWTLAGLLVSESEQKLLDSSPSQPIPADKFLLLGDNRDNSNDSHSFGLIPRSSFQGRVRWQYWPRVRSF